MPQWAVSNGIAPPPFNLPVSTKTSIHPLSQVHLWLSTYIAPGQPGHHHGEHDEDDGTYSRPVRVLVCSMCLDMLTAPSHG